MVPLGVTRSGHLYYRTTNLSEFNQVGFVAELATGAARITKTFIGEGISWSPDGKSLAYIRNTREAPAVMIRAVESGEERAYPIPLLGLQQVRWLPDSSGVIVFVRGDSNAQGGFMYSLDLRSGEYKRLVAIPAGRSGVVAVSPDGKSLYVGEEGANAREIFCVDLASGSERSIGMLPSGGGTPGLSISPDGTSLVAQTWADQPKRLGRLIIVKTDGSGTRELLSSFPADRTLSVVRWTADGRHILYFTTAENGDWRLMRISPTGGQPEFAGLDSTKLTGTVRIPPPGPFSPLSMDASPDGAQIVFAFRPALHTELWTLDNVLSVVGSRQ
jgi:Tol biopolymer transport system component